MQPNVPCMQPGPPPDAARELAQPSFLLPTFALLDAEPQSTRQGGSRTSLRSCGPGGGRLRRGRRPLAPLLAQRQGEAAISRPLHVKSVLAMRVRSL